MTESKTFKLPPEVRRYKAEAQARWRAKKALLKETKPIENPKLLGEAQ